MANRDRIKTLFFVAYAHKDEEYAKHFIEEFKEMSAPSERYEYQFWQDTAILPGEHWKDEIAQALVKCNMGLLLVSPAFLGSKFIDEVELPAFTKDRSKPIIPIMLKKVNLKRHNLKGLDKNQIFMHKVNDLKEEKSFAQCGRSQKSDFIYDLFDKVESRLDKLYR